MILIIYGGSPYDISLNGSLFEIPDKPSCYVRQCLLYAYFATLFFEMCLGVLHYNSLYALSLHSTLAHLWVPFSLGVSWNKRTIASLCNKLKLSLHITQTETYLQLLKFYLHMS